MALPYMYRSRSRYISYSKPTAKQILTAELAMYDIHNLRRNVRIDYLNCPEVEFGDPF